jgi:hypothetical protein
MNLSPDMQTLAGLLVEVCVRDLRNQRPSRDSNATRPESAMNKEDAEHENDTIDRSA